MDSLHDMSMCLKVGADACIMDFIEAQRRGIPAPGTRGPKKSLEDLCFFVSRHMMSLRPWQWTEGLGGAFCSHFHSFSFIFMFFEAFRRLGRDTSMAFLRCPRSLKLCEFQVFSK